MTIVNAFRLPALAIIASAQATQLDVPPPFRVMEALHADAPAILSASYPQSPEMTPAKAALQHREPGPPAPGTAEAVDIWDRLRAGFGLTDADDLSVQAHIDTFHKYAFFVEQILRRSEPYLFHILTRVEQRGLPTELALLPVIESAFDPFARSPSGAAGIWQFMPATADEVGLRRDWWFDGRRDIVAATEAALDYLSALRQRYDGDWLLALAAYNAGSARVNRAIRTNRSQGRPADFWHLPLPDETRNYVPKLIALRAVLTNPSAYGITLPALGTTRYFTIVETGGQLDLQVAARLTGASLEELRRLNPGLIRSVTPPGSSHKLLVPRATERRFRERLAQLPADQRVQSVRYRVRPGDTLSVIAQHSRTTVARLRQINQLEGSRIIAGKVLIVPVYERKEAANDAMQKSVANG
jgi:membrane-bound lytic murein transglycosylase D